MLNESEVTNGTGVINVAIIEDQRDIRECLTFLFNGTSGYVHGQLSHNGRSARKDQSPIA